MRKLLITSCIFLLFGCGSETSSPSAAVAGPKGDKGDPGTPGLTIASGILCLKVATVGSNTLNFAYRSIVYSTGDRWVAGEISGGVTASSSSIFKASQSGATTGSVIVTATLTGDTYGYWQYTSQAGVTKTVYTSTGSPSNNYTLTFASSDCTTF